MTGLPPISSVMLREIKTQLGNVTWNQSGIGGSAVSTTVNKIDFDSTGHFVASVKQTWDDDPLSWSIVRFDSDGNAVWNRRLLNPENDQIADVDIAVSDDAEIAVFSTICTGIVEQRVFKENDCLR